MSEFKVAHLTTVDLSLRFLVMPQLLAVVDAGGQAIGISAPGPWVESLSDAGIRHIPLTASTRGMSLRADLVAAVQLWRVLKRERLSVLHTHNPKPGLYGRVLGRLAGVPLVVNTMHGFYATEDDPLSKRAVVYLLEAVAARASDIELHQNPEDLDLARRMSIVPRGKGSLLGNGVDLTRFDPDHVDPHARARLRAELGVGDDQIVVGIVGRLVAEKGFPELFEAFSGLDDRFRLVVIGPDDPDKSDSLPRETVNAAVARGVIFLGLRTDVDELYTAMDVFVLPSHREGFPRAAMEAAAMGLPIVATDIRGCRQVVDDEVNGLLVPVNDPDALRDAIYRVGDHTSWKAEAGAASRQIALERFDERRVVEIVMDSYRRGLIDKGLGHLLPETLAGTMQLGPVRPATAADAPALAGLHVSDMGGGLARHLGIGFTKILYEALVRWPGGRVFVVDDQVGPVGVAAGVADAGRFYRWLFRSYAMRVAIAAGLRLVSNSRSIRRLVRDDSTGPGDSGEVLSLVVAGRARARGLSIALGGELLTSLSDMGCEQVKAVVEQENAIASSALGKLGFSNLASSDGPNGGGHTVLVWQADWT